jgi:formate dehydrogenase subunit gamma
MLPIIGYTLFAWLAALSKNLHNFVAPIFMVSVAIFAILFVRHNLPRAYDFIWFRNALGYVTGKKHVASGKFNAGEKVWFWGGVVVLSIVVSWSGLILLFPNFDQTRAVMQDAWIWHAVAALLYIAMSLGHIYLGTLGVEGAYQAMRTGYVDEVWAKEHHEHWYNEMKAGGDAAASGAIPAGAPHMRDRS